MSSKTCGVQRWITIERHGNDVGILMQVRCLERGKHEKHVFTFRLDKLKRGESRRNTA